MATTYIHPHPSVALESLVDASTVASVVEYLAEVCRAKAQHIRDNWQDAATASNWDAAARKLERLTFTV